MQRRPSHLQGALRIASILTREDRFGAGAVWIRAVWFSDSYFRAHAHHWDVLYHETFTSIGLLPGDVRVRHWRSASVQDGEPIDTPIL